MRSEHVEQREFVRDFRRAFPGVLIFAIPNGGARSSSVAAGLKAEGVTPGVPDLCIPAWGPLWIEMKRADGGEVSDSQRKVHAYLRQYCGQTVIVAHGAEDAKSQLERCRKMPQPAAGHEIDWMPSI